VAAAAARAREKEKQRELRAEENARVRSAFAAW
jgi:hypothetical protein